MKVITLATAAMFLFGSVQFANATEKNTTEKNAKQKGQSVQQNGKITIQVNGETKTIEFGEQSSDAAESQSGDDTEDKPGISVQTIMSGHGIVIGPDGKKQEFQFGNSGANDQALKNLPEPIRKRIEEAMKNPLLNAKLGKGIMIAPNGKSELFNLGTNKEFKQSLKNFPQEAQQAINEAMQQAQVLSASGGRAIFIGPDGVQQEFNFGDLNAKDLHDKFVTELLEPAKLKHQQALQKSENSEVDQKEVLQKLNTILERIESLEKEVKSLKESK